MTVYWVLSRGMSFPVLTFQKIAKLGSRFVNSNNAAGVPGPGCVACLCAERWGAGLVAGSSFHDFIIG